MNGSYLEAQGKMSKQSKSLLKEQKATGKQTVPQQNPKCLLTQASGYGLRYTTSNLLQKTDFSATPIDTLKLCGLTAKHLFCFLYLASRQAKP